MVAPLVNWAVDRDNRLTRPVIEAVDRDRPPGGAAEIPRPQLSMRAKRRPPARQRGRARPSAARPCSMRPASSITTIPRIGEATRAVLAQNGVETEVALSAVLRHAAARAGRARRASPTTRAHGRGELVPMIDEGYDIVALVPSCALMLKFEWPLHPAGRPGDRSGWRAPPSTSANTSWTSPRRKDWRPACKPLPGGVTPASRLPCAGAEHGAEGGRDAAAPARARHRGDRALLGPWRLVGRDEGEFRGRRSRSGGRSRARPRRNAKAYLASECPLAGVHIAQGMELLAARARRPSRVTRSS